MSEYPKEFKKSLRPELSVFPGVTMVCGGLTVTCDDYIDQHSNMIAAIDELYLKWKRERLLQKVGKAEPIERSVSGR